MTLLGAPACINLSRPSSQSAYHAVAVPPHEFVSRILYDLRHPPRSPRADTDYHLPHSNGLVCLKLDPITVCGVHAREDDHGLGGAHLPEKRLLQGPAGVALDRAMLRYAAIPPTEVGGFVQPVDHSPIVVGVGPRVADEDHSRTKVGHRRNQDVGDTSINHDDRVRPAGRHVQQPYPQGPRCRAAVDPAER